MILFCWYRAVALSLAPLDKEFYHGSNESSASIHICIQPSRYSVAYLRGLSIAKAFKAHSEHGVVFNPSSVSA